MSYYGGTGFGLSGFFGGLVERWGPMLLYGALVYAVIASIMQMYALSAGISVNLLVPGVGGLAKAAYGSWAGLSQAFKDSSLSGAEILKLAYASTTTAILLMGLLMQAAVNYIWMAVQLSELIPPPYQFLTVVVWIVMGIAQTILFLYIVERLAGPIQQLAQTIISLFRGAP